MRDLLFLGLDKLEIFKFKLHINRIIPDSYSKADLERLKSTLEMKQVSYERPRSQSREV